MFNFANRYREDAEVFKQSSSLFQNSTTPESKSSMSYTWHFFRVAFNLNKSKYPTSCSQKMALCSLFCICKYMQPICYSVGWPKQLYYNLECISALFITLWCFIFIYGGHFINYDIHFYLLIVISALCVLSFVILSRQPQTSSSIPFQVAWISVIHFFLIFSFYW